MEKFLLHTKYFILYTILFLFPLFFLPFTQEFFVTNKLYLLIVGALLLLAVSLIQFVTTKKLVWQKAPLDVPVLIFVISIALSVLLSSPNRIQAILNPNFGLAEIVSLSVFYYYLSRVVPEKSGHMGSLLQILNISAVILSIITIIFFFNPFKNANFPAYFQFLKSSGFTPLGDQLNLALFLGFFAILALVSLIKNKYTKYSTLNTGYFAIILLALLLTSYSLYKQLPILPPFNISWYAAVETLKQPLTALFGVGIDNFASMFTRVKDIYYNQSTLWQINSFAVSRSAVLQIFTEAGLFGIVAFLVLVVSLIRSSQITQKKLTENTHKWLPLLYVLIVMLLFPVSLPVIFLFFLLLAIQQSANPTIKSSTDLAEIIPLFLGIIIIGVAVIGILTYFTAQSYLAEYYFKKSLDGYMANNAQALYDNQRQAIIINPYIERFHINFSQTNLLLADNIAAKAGKNKLSEQDKQTITQAIQAAIAEAKAAVALNPQKSANWENLAVIYRNILSVAQGADAWTVSAYQRAIVLDPQNPIYRLNLGGVYYSLASYDQAEQLFEQAASLKPDWANAHYNLAWSAYKKKDYQLAASEMQNVLNLVNPNSDKTDYDRASQELEQFKKFLPSPTPTPEATRSAKPQLTLPTRAPSISPKITLPKTASPEAK